MLDFGDHSISSCLVFIIIILLLLNSHNMQTVCYSIQKILDFCQVSFFLYLFSMLHCFLLHNSLLLVNCQSLCIHCNSKWRMASICLILLYYFVMNWAKQNSLNMKVPRNTHEYRTWKNKCFLISPFIRRSWFAIIQVMQDTATEPDQLCCG